MRGGKNTNSQHFSKLIYEMDATLALNYCFSCSGTNLEKSRWIVGGFPFTLHLKLHDETPNSYRMQTSSLLQNSKGYNVSFVSLFVKIAQICRIDLETIGFHLRPVNPSSPSISCFFFAFRSRKACSFIKLKILRSCLMSLFCTSPLQFPVLMLHIRPL